MSISQTIKKMAKEAMDSGSPLQLVEGIVQSPLPNIQLKLKSNSKLIIPSDLIGVAEHLTSHTRTANISSSKVSGNTDESGDPEHKHKIDSVSLTSTTISFDSNLNTGDKVMVAVVQGGQSFFVIDKIKG